VTPTTLFITSPKYIPVESLSILPEGFLDALDTQIAMQNLGTRAYMVRDKNIIKMEVCIRVRLCGGHSHSPTIYSSEVA
jgi:hypothetical protein